MQKKWIYYLSLIILFFGVLGLSIQTIVPFWRGFTAGYRDAAAGIYEPTSFPLSDSLVIINIGIIIVAILLLGFNRILNKLDKFLSIKSDNES